MGLDKLYVLICCVERTPKVCTDLIRIHRDLYINQTRGPPERGPLTS